MKVKAKVLDNLDKHNEQLLKDAEYFTQKDELGAVVKKTKPVVFSHEDNSREVEDDADRRHEASRQDYEDRMLDRPDLED